MRKNFDVKSKSLRKYNRKRLQTNKYKIYNGII